ncbi:Hypothetical protein A7982_07714 [Minicystis rosea]|nr:Hypothetical protein A7982_07714 [Minicystis rosea]
MQRFRQAVEAFDLDALEQCLAEDVEFLSPVVFKPYRGRAVVGALLRRVAGIFEDFHYVAELRDGDQTALVFQARVGDRAVDGIDLGRVDPETGLVTHLSVFIRPMSGAQALAAAVVASLTEGGASV